jgi:hypothetical protein
MLPPVERKAEISWLALLAGVLMWLLLCAGLVTWAVLAWREAAWSNAIQPIIYGAIVIVGGLVGIPWASRYGLRSR